jgi:hypothetical protein
MDLLGRHNALDRGKLTKKALVSFYNLKKKKIDDITKQPVAPSRKNMSNLLQLFWDHCVYDKL